MKRSSFALVSALLYVLLSGCTSQPVAGDVLFVHVNVIDTFHGTVLPDQSVLIKGDRILAMGNRAEDYSAPLVIDGKDKFLIPGLWDMHTHNFWDKHFSSYYIGNGILGVRNMYTPMHLITPLNDSITAGLLPGPHYVAAGRIVEGPNPSFPDWLVLDSEEDIGAILDTLQQEGSDFVKVYNKIPRDLYFALAKEAGKRNLTIQGHVPMAVTALEASEAGQKSIEHLLGIPNLCTRDPLFSKDFGSDWFKATMESDDLATLAIDPAYAAENFSVLKRNNTHVVPTLSVWHNYLYPDEKFEEDGISAKFSEDVRVFWFGNLDSFRQKDSTYKAIARRKYENLKNITRLLHQSGVPLLAGTDAVNPCVYPGFALHKELYLLKDCGIPDKEILKMATWGAAAFLGLGNDFGLIEEGKLASLVLLNHNPLDNIAHTSDINTVVLKGKVYDREALDKMLE